MITAELNSPKVLIVTFEFAENISGGIGTCLNGLVPELSKLTPMYTGLIFWNSLINNFSCSLYYENKIETDHLAPFETKISAIIDFFQIQILHIHHASKETLQLILTIKKNHPKIRVVYSCHSIFKHEKKIREIPKEWILFEEQILKESHCIHLLNQTSKKWLDKSYPKQMQKKESHIIANAINRHERVNSQDKDVVVCATRWAPGKGVEFLLEAIPRILKIRPEVKFILIGRNPDAWGKHVEKYVKKIDKKIKSIRNSNIIVHDWLPKAQLYKLIQSASVYVIPSEIEYFPYSFLEPASLGIPIVSSKLETIHEIAKDNIHFLGFPVGKPKIMAEKILEILNNEKLAYDLQNNASKLATEQYSWEFISKEYVKMYSRTLDA